MYKCWKEMTGRAMGFCGRTVTGFSSQCALCVFSLLTASSISLFAQTTPAAGPHPCSGGLIEERNPCTVALSLGQTVDLQFTVPQGNVRTLTAEQIEGVVELRLSD